MVGCDKIILVVLGSAIICNNSFTKDVAVVEKINEYLSVRVGRILVGVNSAISINGTKIKMTPLFPISATRVHNATIMNSFWIITVGLDDTDPDDIKSNICHSVREKSRNLLHGVIISEKICTFLPRVELNKGESLVIYSSFSRVIRVYSNKFLCEGDKSGVICVGNGSRNMLSAVDITYSKCSSCVALFNEINYNDCVS